MKKKIIGFFSGVGYGIATAIPGLSGGTMLVVFGCYDIVCEALALNIKSIKKNIVFLVIFAIGAATGVFGLAHALTYMITHIPLITYLLLAALVIAGVPVVLRNISAEKEPPYCVSLKGIAPALFGYAVVVLLFVLEMLGISGVERTAPPVMLIIFTAIAGVTSIIPGVSGSFMLVILGAYETVMVAIKDFDLNTLVFVAIGVVLGLVGGSRLITFLLDKAKTMVYCAIFGMLIASALMLVADSVIKYG